MLTVDAPAKLNLTLEVLGKRPDGYHEIRSVVQTIDLCDRLHFQRGSRTEFKSGMPGWVAEKSLVPKATERLRSATGYTGGATIEVDKRIPLMSGLGGDSSDAAAVLLGLNRLWELALPQKRLLGLASELGSDVAFFLYGGTALMEGRGEKVTLLPPPPATWVVLVVPEAPREPGKTAKAYASLSGGDYADGQATKKLEEVLKSGGEFTSSMQFNTFERIAFNNVSEIDICRRQVVAAGAANVHLTGSGPALFSLASDEETAGDLYRRLQLQGLEAYLVKTLAVRGLPDGA